MLWKSLPPTDLKLKQLFDVSRICCWLAPHSVSVHHLLVSRFETPRVVCGVAVYGKHTFWSCLKKYFLSEDSAKVCRLS